MVKPDRVKRTFSKSEVAKALERGVLSKTSDLQDLQAPSYLFAVLTDARITG